MPAFTSIALGLGAAASVAGAAMMSSSQKKAASSAQKTGEAAIDWERERYYDEQRRRDPYYFAGTGALPSLNNMVRGGYDITQEPEYKVAAGDRVS